MKVKITYEIEFTVTREVEFDDSELRDWIDFQASRGRTWDSEDGALLAFLRDDDMDEFHAEQAFHDWRTDQPLPDDFVLYNWAVDEIERVPETGEDHG